MPDESTYGFNKDDADEIVSKLGIGEGTYKERGGNQQNRLIRVKTKGTCAAANNSTGAMSSVSCDRYNANTDGTFTDAGYDITVWNPGGEVASGAWGSVMLNEAGLYEFVVVKCG